MSVTGSSGRKHFSLRSVVGGEEVARRTPRARATSLNDFTRIKASSKALYRVLVWRAAQNILRDEFGSTRVFWIWASNNALLTRLVLRRAL